jgi:predicted nucleic acid-binding protein
MTPATVVSFLDDRFDEPWLILPPAAHAALLREASEKAVSGGALYDALVGATVRHAGATLLTRDRRASRVYDALGVMFRFVT